MNTSQGTALEIALADHHAWTSRDFERAMTYVADDIVCQAPAGTLHGADAFRGLMGSFTKILTASSLIAAFGDDDKAVLIRHRHRPRAGRAGRRVPDVQQRQDHPHADHLRPGARRFRDARRGFGRA